MRTFCQYVVCLCKSYYWHAERELGSLRLGGVRPPLQKVGLKVPPLPLLPTPSDGKGVVPYGLISY